MTTQFVDSTHNFRIAYDQQGRGPALLLVHGFSNDRRMWQEWGWVAALQEQYTVITCDVRGCGESTATHDPAAYTQADHLADLAAVLDACEVNDCLYWGWSFGGTIGTHFAATSKRVHRAVIAGTYFGPIFSQGRWVQDNQEIAKIASAKREGRLDESGLEEPRRRFAEAIDLDLLWARRYAAESWPAIAPADLCCPTFLYTGTNDGTIVTSLQEQQPAIEAAGHRLHIFDDFDHIQLVSERASVLPVIGPFLAGQAPSGSHPK